MKVHGYTEQKKTVEVDLSIDEIVSAGIDPWRLDLFDPDPIERNVDGTQLFFTRLHDLSFAYEGEDGRCVIALHDGASTSCLLGAEQHVDEQGVTLTDIAISANTFDYHLQYYLDHYDWNTWFAPKPAQFVKVRGNTVSFTFLHQDTAMRSLSSLCYTGNMFTQVSTAVQLPESVNWVLRAFAPWHPVVFGPALRNAVSAKPVRTVRFVMDKEGLQFVVDVFAQHCVDLADPSNFEFELNGCRYEPLARTGSGLITDWFRSLPDLYSADALHSSKENEVCGARIAFFDAGNLQARRLFAPATDAAYYPDRKELEEDGFKVVTVEKKSTAQ